MGGGARPVLQAGNAPMGERFPLVAKKLAFADVHFSEHRFSHFRTRAWLSLRSVIRYGWAPATNDRLWHTRRPSAFARSSSFRRSVLRKGSTACSLRCRLWRCRSSYARAALRRRRLVAAQGPKCHGFSCNPPKLQFEGAPYSGRRSAGPARISAQNTLYLEIGA